MKCVVWKNIDGREKLVAAKLDSCVFIIAATFSVLFGHAAIGAFV